MKTELSQGRGNFWTPFERETELEATVWEHSKVSKKRKTKGKERKKKRQCKWIRTYRRGNLQWREAEERHGG